MSKIMRVVPLIALFSVGAFAEGEYFTLPENFVANSTATIAAIAAALLAVRVFPIGWKYLTQFFGKRNA